MARKKLAAAEERLPDPHGALKSELEHARSILEVRRRLDDVAAHEFRRSMKRARALLRLLRDVVGERAYARENRTLRDAARVLGPMRDAQVLRKTLAEVGAHPARDSLPRAQPAPVKPLLAALAGAKARTDNWRMPRAKWPALAAGIERLYRHGRYAVRTAEAQPTDRNLHESRKQIKRLGATLAFLEPVGVKKVKKLVKRADAVAENLGDDHDLALLGRRAGSYGLEPAVRARVRKRRRKLQKRALKKAGRLFRAKPKRFLKRLARAPIGA